MEGPQLLYTHPLYKPSRFDALGSASVPSLPSLTSFTGSKDTSASQLSSQQLQQQEANKPLSESGLRQVIEPKVISDCSQKPVKITYRIEKQGFYNIVFSNEHSWYGVKTLKYRWCVLVPSERPVVRTQEMTQASMNMMSEAETQDVETVGDLVDLFGDSSTGGAMAVGSNGESQS